MHTKNDMLDQLQALLRDLFTARDAGASYTRLARAHGYVDGYMGALLAGGVASKEELLEVVARKRAEVSGPPFAAVPLDDVA